MLAHNYVKGVNKIQLFGVSNYAYSIDEPYVTDWLVVLFTSKDFSAIVFTVGEKAMPYQTHN